jgi:hypothetical protein
MAPCGKPAYRGEHLARMVISATAHEESQAARFPCHAHVPETRCCPLEQSSSSAKAFAGLWVGKRKRISSRGHESGATRFKRRGTGSSGSSGRVNRRFTHLRGSPARQAAPPLLVQNQLSSVKRLDFSRASSGARAGGHTRDPLVAGMVARLLWLRPLLPSRTGHQTSIARLSRCFSRSKEHDLLGKQVVHFPTAPCLHFDHTSMQGGTGFHEKQDALRGQVGI